MLDAKTAFDVVSHSSLNRKLFLDGIQDLLRVIQDLQKDATTRIKWKKHLSDPFRIRQGVRQGGIISTEFYKRYNNTLLNQLDDAKHGVFIESIHCAAPTCADDIALLATSPLDLQIQIDMVKQYSLMERYELQPSKSCVLPVKPKTPS